MRVSALALFFSSAAVAQAPTVRPAEAGPPVATQPGLAPAEGPAGWRERFDDLWQKRDEPGVEKQLEGIVHEQLAVEPRSFEANWRLASLLNWEADGTDGDEKAALGKQAWEAGDKAILANPQDVRGHYYSGVGVGLYSEGVGILTALSQGLEGKFRDRLQAALKIERNFLDGAPQVVWGRYFYKLPWPKRDVDESIRVLTQTVKSHPRNWRAKIYLADSLVGDARSDEGRKLVQEVLDAKRGGSDPPDDKRLKDRARKWMADH